MFMYKISMFILKMISIKHRNVWVDMFQYKVKKQMKLVMRWVYKWESIISVVQRIHRPFERIMELKAVLSYTIHLTKPTLTLLWCYYSHELQRILIQDLLLDLQTCIRVPSHHPPFWLPPFILRFSSILTTNPMNLHHSSAFQTAGAQP